MMTATANHAMERTFICFVAVLCVLAASGTQSAPVVASIPRDLAVRAQFFPGAGSSWMIPKEAAKLPKPWTAMITASGKASQATTLVTDPSRSLPMLMRPGKGDPPVSAAEMRAVNPPNLKTVQITEARLQHIVQAIGSAKFFTLPRDISTPWGEHTASVVLRITMDGRTRQVAFEWPNERFDRSGLLRFWSVWSAVTRAIPSPNRNNELDYWTNAVGLRLPKQI